MTEHPSDRRPRHIPVLSHPLLQHLKPHGDECWIDATVGTGGHTQLILGGLGPYGRLIALDQDAAMLEIARARIQDERVVFVHAGFDQIRDVLREQGIVRVDGLIADLGVCSDQLDDPERGLSFLADGPLDMRLNREVGQTAADLVNRLSEHDLSRLFREYGEERFSKRIARKIVAARQKQPITQTGQLAGLIKDTIGKPGKQRIHPATRVFQALRIAVNDELGALERLLKILPSVITAGGRVGIISFHSLEDRLVKRAFQDKEIWKRINRKPVQATDDEIRNNPRSRSAKLRMAVRKSSEPEHSRDRGEDS